MLGCGAVSASLSDCGGELAEGRDGWTAAEDSGAPLKSRRLACTGSWRETGMSLCAVEMVMLLTRRLPPGSWTKSRSLHSWLVSPPGSSLPLRTESALVVLLDLLPPGS